MTFKKASRTSNRIKKSSSIKSTDSETMAIVFILAFIASLGIATFLHDPILHYLPAYFFGWHLDSFTMSLLTGDTIVAIPPSIHATTLQMWVFYMFPALFITASVILLSLYTMNRLVFVFSTSAIMLNFASLDFSIKGSDANNAFTTLINSGTPVDTAYAIHITIFISALIAIALFFYVIFENNSKDSKTRLKTIT